MYSLNGGRKDPINLLHRYNTYIVDIHIKKELENLGYKVFVVASKKDATPKQINKDIDNVINNIIEYIESAF